MFYPYTLETEKYTKTDLLSPTKAITKGLKFKRNFSYFRLF